MAAAAAFGFLELRIFVTDLVGKTITMVVNAFHTIRRVKADISEKTGFPVHEQRLMFQDRRLDDSHSVQQCNIQNESHVWMSIQIIVNLRPGGAIYLNVAPYHDVHWVIRKLSDQARIPLQGDETFRFGDRLILNNQRTLSYYGIYQGCLLHMYID